MTLLKKLTIPVLLALVLLLAVYTHEAAADAADAEGRGGNNNGNNGNGWGNGGNNGGNDRDHDHDDDDDSSDDECSGVNKRSIYKIDFRRTRVVNGTIAGWFNYAAGTYVANDGDVSIQQASRDCNDPYLYLDTRRFTKTVPLDAFGGNDHPKQLQFYAQAQPVPSKGSLVCRAKLTGQNFNVQGHPYGSAVRDPQSDYRLATSSLVTIDLNLGMTADFFITNTQIYILYERLPFARTASNNYYAYTYVVPVASRSPSDVHDAYIVYDGANQQIHWWLDGKRVYTVEQPGTLDISRNYLALDRCGTEESVFPKNINCGLGTFTILDGFPGCPATTTTANGGKVCSRKSTDKALVQIEPSGYCNPLNGTNAPPPFVYENSRGTGKTLYGQGASLKVFSFEIYTQSDSN